MTFLKMSNNLIKNFIQKFVIEEGECETCSKLAVAAIT